jgi:hypothetical protein
LLFAWFRYHRCLAVIHSEQPIWHVLKYYSKNSDFGRISLQNVVYGGAVLSPAPSNCSILLQPAFDQRVNALPVFADMSDVIWHQLSRFLVLTFRDRQ